MTGSWRRCTARLHRAWPVRPGGGMALAMLAAVAVSACTVGPAYKKPPAAVPSTWHELQQGGAPDSASTPTMQADADPRWWRSFNDPVLDHLVERAVRGNLDLQEAVLRIAEARTQQQSAAAQGLPNVRATASYTREQLGVKGLLESQGVYGKVDQLNAPNSPLNQITPGLGASAQQGANQLLDQLTSPINLWQAGFDASWELDLFGRVRRSVEAAGAQTQAALEDRNDALVSLEAEVAQTYAQLRGAQALRAVTAQLIDDQRQVLELTRSQARVGLTSGSDVDNASAQLTTLQAQLPQYEAQIAEALNGLAYLVGEPPGALDAELSVPGAVPPVPPSVPVGLPSALARRRPDIRAAEARLHAATAQVGVAVAQFYPDISLTGQVGTRGTNARDLAHWSSLFYSFGPSISLPIFQGGALVANLKLSKVQQAQAALAYRKAVLTGLRDVENALVVYRTDQARRDALAQTVGAQQTSFHLARDSYRKGIVTFINVLDAERQLAQVRQQYVQSTTQVSTDLVALYKALGGGWQPAAQADAGHAGKGG